MWNNMNKWKKTVCLALAGLSLAACSKSLSLDPADTVDSLQGKLSFTDQMAELTPEKAYQIYGVQEELVQNCAALRGSGATAESFSVWQAKDADSAEQLEEQLEDFLQNWIEGYADYKPEEVPKLESAVLEQQDCYVILCVSADNENAGKLIGQMLNP